MRKPVIYILASHTGRALYIGVTTNLPRRPAEHRTGEVPRLRFAKARGYPARLGTTGLKPVDNGSVRSPIMGNGRRFHARFPRQRLEAIAHIRCSTAR